MKFTTAALTTFLFGASALAAPSAPAKRQDSVEYDIVGFGERKYDGVNINTVYFNITATNGGSLNFECFNYDPATDAASENFEAGHVYQCGKNSLFSFSFTPGNGSTDTDADLNLWQDVSESKTYVGEVKFEEPICHAGGSSASDEVCSALDTYEICMTVAGSSGY